MPSNSALKRPHKLNPVVSMRNMVKLMSLLILSHTVFADVITLRSDEWYPMSGVPGSDKPGFMIEIAERAWADSGHTVDYQIMPWERALVAVEQGEFDCVVGAYHADAPTFIFPEEAIGMDDAGFYGLVGDKFAYSIDALKAKKIAVIGGYAYDEGEIDELIKAGGANVQVSKGNSALEKNIKMLLAGRVDIAIESPAVMEAKLSEMGVAGKVVELTTLNDPSGLHIACSPNKPTSELYTQQLSAGVKKLRASGELVKIMAKYGLTDWK